MEKATVYQKQLQPCVRAVCNVQPFVMKQNSTPMRESSLSAWDHFAASQKNGCVYHLAAWTDAINRSYLHDADYFMASRNPSDTGVRVLGGKEAIKSGTDNEVSEISGILPIVHIRHRLFGNSLVSMPFCDSGGVLAEDGIIEQRLIEHVLNVANERHVPVVELRQYHPLSCMDDPGFAHEAESSGWRQIRTVPGWRVSAGHDNSKVRMLLELPASADLLMQSFDAKLRSQIRKATKNGLVVKAGGIELVDDFYDVFCVNMRDLGSPVHSKKFIVQVLRNYSENARIFIVYGQGKPMACGMTLGFRDVLSNPWASFLRRYSHLAPNMLLYWGMLEHACQKGYRVFDFGRSTVDEGTYRFKRQWGAKPESLHWYRFTCEKRAVSGIGSKRDRMNLIIELWKRLPVPVTRVLGPMIRRYISL